VHTLGKYPTPLALASPTFLFVFFAVLGLELRAFTLSHSTSPFLLYLFLRYGFMFLPGARHRLQSSYLCFPSSWDDRHIPPYSTYLLRWGLTDFLPGLASNLNPPNLCFLSS
jgi:hypothetical protein